MWQLITGHHQPCSRSPLNRAKLTLFVRVLNSSWARLRLLFAQLLPFCPTRHCEATLRDLCLSLRYLTRSLFDDFLNNLLDKFHLNKDHFNTHSFRIGAASSARDANIFDHQIQMLGRWRSDAYKLYIRTSPTDLAKFSKVLAAGSQSHLHTLPI